MIFENELIASLFDKPRISQQQNDAQNQKIKINYEPNKNNSQLVTNPQAALKFLKVQIFIKLNATQQDAALNQLIQILDANENNCLIILELVNSASSRHNQAAIQQLKQGKLPTFDQEFGSPQDILFQLILMGLTTKNQLVGQILKTLNQSSNILSKVHFELVYQYVRLKGQEVQDYAQSNLLPSMVECLPPSQVSNYFFFNGFLSGILLNSKQVISWPFTKGFAASCWFQISKTQMQDPKNLPVLFNCYSTGFGGFECYFNQNKLLYRILPPTAYTPPTDDSNGVFISEFQAERWNYVGVEHDKPFLARAQLIAVVNDKQVLNFSMDYPKFEKQSKLFMVSVCNNFIGKMSSFILFKEQINNPQKFVQIYKQHAADFSSLNAQVFDQKLQDKLFLLYSAQRFHGKTVYDWIDMNDGELLINCGVVNNKRKPYLQDVGGLIGLMPLLERCKTAQQTNQFLKLVLLSIGNSCDSQGDFNAVFTVLFSLIQQLPYGAVNVQTIHLLTELRFTIQDKHLIESFFTNLMMSADFWINVSKFSQGYETMCEYWSFVKSIYSQNPVQYNSLYPIHNLIDLMKRIAEVNQKFCCEYHQKSQKLFYGTDEKHNEEEGSQEENYEIQVNKYLEPICGVLEIVLTGAGDEILLEIEHVAKSLCLKSSACFHLQMLKLLKVLLLDSKQNNKDCASPADFAQKFLNCRGLQILLYLCSNNAMIDVKAMCIKLIDVLSSQTQLIQMRIDTDLITYLEHVILPKQMIKVRQEHDDSVDIQQKPGQINYQQINNEEEPNQELLCSPKKQGLQFFSYEAVQEDVDQKEDSFEEQNEKIFSKTLGANSIRNQQLINSESDEEYHTVGPGVPIAPKATSKVGDQKGFNFGFGDDGSEDEEERKSFEDIQEQEQEQEDELSPVQIKIAKPRGLKNLQFSDENVEVFKAPPSKAEFHKKFGDKVLGDFDSDEDKKRNDEEAPKATQDVLMSRNLRGGVGKGFKFELAMSDSEEEEPKPILKPPPMGVRNKQPPILGKKFGAGLKLQINDEEEESNKPKAREDPHQRIVSDSDDNPACATGATNDIELPKKVVKPGMKLALDIEKINDLFTFGGEKGDFVEDEANLKLETDIKELAQGCLDHMRSYKNRKQTDESQFDIVLDQPFKSFNKPQTVKGIKNIEQQRQLSLTGISEDSLAQANLTNEQLLQYQNQTQQVQGPDDYTIELENLYTSCLEWILNRAPSSLYKSLMIDDYDKIMFQPAMQILMILVTHSNNMVRQRALQDMFMLAQWDSQNGQMILQHQSFHMWLLELLMPYQNSQKQNDSDKALFDMGTKLHTLLLKNACSNEEDDGFKKVNLLTRWPAVAKEKGYSVNTAHMLVRNLTQSLVNSLFPTINGSNLKQSPTLRNLIHITLQFHELALSSHDQSTDSDDELNRGDMNESLLQWLVRNQFLKFTKQEDRNVWAEWSVLYSLAKCWDNLFVGKQVTEYSDESDLVETIRSNLTEKNQDQLQECVDVLMLGSSTTTSPAHQQTRLSMFANFGRQEKGKVEDGVNIFQAITNLTCIAVMHADRQRDLTQQWLKRLEIYFKYALMLSELWKPGKTDEFQKKVSQTCSFILAFLFQEVHTTQTPKAQTQTELSSSSNSDKQSSKYFTQCLKRCFIFLVTLADQKNDSACKIILDQILLKQVKNQTKPLININSDVARLIESNFEDFPECFQQNDWKIAFFHNQTIKQITKSQLNLKILNQYQTKRQQYAARIQESEINTNQAKEEILKKIQAETLQAISELTQQEHENKNDHQFVLDVQQRNADWQLIQWNNQVKGLRGMWCVQQNRMFQRISSQTLGEGQRCLLTDTSTNSFSYIKDRSFESQIFKKVYKQQQEMTTDNQNSRLSKRLSQIQKDELQPRYKQILEERILSQLKPQRKKIIQVDDVEILMPLEKKQGSLIMTNYELIVIVDLVQNVDKHTNIHFFQNQIEDSSKLYKSYFLSSLKEIQKRRFLGQNKALEIFFMSGKSTIVNFKSIEDRDQFAKKILRQRQNKCKNLKYFTSLDHKWILKKKLLTEEWMNWRISNFDYLMQLNQLAGRSYNDLSQYPVFPWILSQLSGQQIPDLTATSIRGSAAPSQFRDLQKNMQLLGSAERQAEFKRKYEDQESFIGIDDRFHCGSHYSNPGIVLHYMSRMQPVLEANIVLQGKQMDNPDRIFQQIEHSYRNSLNDFSDVRELIPEFFCLPEMFMNSNDINFGYKQDGTKVDDVRLPEWCNKNPYLFVQVMREALESQYVSTNLNSWIDYIFGFKQRDQEAVLCLNTFSKITYQADVPGDMDITTVQDPVMRSAFENQIYNFGQTPLQLFKDRHAARLPQLQALKSNLIVDEVSKLKIFKPVPVGNQSKVQQCQISHEAILFAKFDDEQRIVGAQKQGYLQSFVWIPKAHDSNPMTPFSLGSDKKSKFNGRERENGADLIDRSIRKFDYPMTVLNQGSFVVKGGFWDGKIAFCAVEGTNTTSFELSGHRTTVSALVCDKKEHTIISGSKSGEVIVWRNTNFDCSIEPSSNSNPWVNFKQLNDHTKQITSVFIHDEMNMFATASLDGQVNLYNLWTAKHFRTLQHPNLSPIQNVVVAQVPLPVCTFYSREDHMWNIFSINGQNLTSSDAKTNQEDASHVIQPIVVKAANSSEKLVYGTERGLVFMRHLPSLVKYRKLQISKEFPVLTLITSPDRRFLLVGCGDGGLIVTTERGEQQQVQPSNSAGYRSQRGSFNDQRESKSGNWMSPLTSLVSRTPQHRN